MQDERRWVWWGQVRDVCAAAAALAIAAVETYRGTYNPIAMGVVLTCLGVTGLGTAGRWLLSRNGNGERKP